MLGNQTHTQEAVHTVRHSREIHVPTYLISLNVIVVSFHLHRLQIFFDCQVLRFGFNIPTKGKSLEETMEQMKPMLVMVFYCIEKVKRYRLSKEVKAKAEKNRQRVEEAFLKSTHAQRAEAAAARREARKQMEKEMVMSFDDPEKQRRWEEKEQKRQAKKRAPKMKQLKVKAL